MHSFNILYANYCLNDKISACFNLLSHWNTKNNVREAFSWSTLESPVSLKINVIVSLRFWLMNTRERNKNLTTKPITVMKNLTKLKITYIFQRATFVYPQIMWYLLKRCTQIDQLVNKRVFASSGRTLTSSLRLVWLKNLHTEQYFPSHRP